MRNPTNGVLHIGRKRLRRWIDDVSSVLRAFGRGGVMASHSAYVQQCSRKPTTMLSNLVFVFLLCNVPLRQETKAPRQEMRLVHSTLLTPGTCFTTG